jgi:hypothetical protein
LRRRRRDEAAEDNDRRHSVDYRANVRGENVSLPNRQLIIFGGGMFRLSSELIRRCMRYQCGGYQCIFVKHVSDTRYSVGNLTTHDK